MNRLIEVVSKIILLIIFYIAALTGSDTKEEAGINFIIYICIAIFINLRWKEND